MKPPTQSSPKAPDPSEDGAKSDSRTPVERALVPSSIPEPTIRNDSSDEYARKLDNALTRPGQATPEENWASLEASYNPDYYAPVEREAREKRQALEQRLALKGIVLPKGTPANVEPSGDMHGGDGARGEGEELGGGEVSIKFRSPLALIYKAVAVGVVISAALVGVYLFGKSQGARDVPSHKDEVTNEAPSSPARVVTPLPEQPTASRQTLPSSEPSSGANVVPPAAPPVLATRPRAPKPMPERTAPQASELFEIPSAMRVPPSPRSAEPKKPEAPPLPPAPDMFR